MFCVPLIMSSLNTFYSSVNYIWKFDGPAGLTEYKLIVGELNAKINLFSTASCWTINNVNEEKLNTPFKAKITAKRRN